MNILAWVHMYPPAHNAGAEYTLKAMLEDMERRGHKTRVRATHTLPMPEQRVGKPVIKDYWRAYLPDFEWADVIVTHLDETRNALEAGAHVGRPVVHLLHNATTLRFWKLKSADLAVFNAEATRKQSGWDGPQIVCRPPVWVADYAGPNDGSKTTLINANENKSGGRVFMAHLTAATPERDYLIVLGDYGRQIPPAGPNVEVIPSTPNINAVYDQTRILIMPSEGETWGRCAVEAACRGIPTVANATPGIVEAMGDAAIYPHSLAPEVWVEALDLSERRWAEYSDRALTRAHELEAQSRRELDDLERALLLTVSGEQAILTP